MENIKSPHKSDFANAVFYIDEIKNENDLARLAEHISTIRRSLRAQEIKAKKATISVGDKVKFEDKNGKEATGTLTKINRTKAIVKVDNYLLTRDDRGILTGASSLTWSVPITLLDLA